MVTLGEAPSTKAPSTKLRSKVKQAGPALRSQGCESLSASSFESVASVLELQVACERVLKPA